MNGIMKGLGVTFKNMVQKKVTYSYPDVPMDMPDRFRGVQYLDPDKCIVCFQCERICPTECIKLSGKPNPDPAKKGKVLSTFDINFELCILCDFCTEVCPTEAIVMTNNFELSAYSRDDLFKNMQWLYENDKNVRQQNHADSPKGGAKQDA